VTELDLPFRERWRTLGEGVHYQVHEAIGSVGRFYPPDPRTSSFITTAGSANGTYPAPSWVSAIDRSWGEVDDALGDFDRLYDAMVALKDYSPRAPDLVVALCIRGRSTVEWKRGVRHWSVEEVAQRYPFDQYEDGVRRAQERLKEAWELLGIIIATPANLRRAVEANAVERKALAWARQRGLVA
jgi:hypothetical protein